MSSKNNGILIFNQHPIVEIATNRFHNIPVILQYDNTPLIEVVKTLNVGFEIQIPIYHSDGTYLAKVKSSQIYPTEAGKKAGITLRHPDKMTICEMAGKTIFEITRKEAATLKTQAELYTPDAAFIKCDDSGIAGYVLDKQSTHLALGSSSGARLVMTHSDIYAQKIGIHIKKDGSILVACS